MRGRSYSPSPPRRGYGRRRYSPSPRGRYGGHERDGPTSLLVRNLRLDCRPEDLRRPFSQFGPLKDVYLPRDYYTGEPRGFGFVQYLDPADAADAKYRMDGVIFQGRELTVVFAEENRKKPTEMRQRERTSGRHYERRRSPPRYSRSPRYARSPPPRYARSRSRTHDRSPSTIRPDSRSVSPKDRKYSRERSYSQENRGGSYSRSPAYRNSRSPSADNEVEKGQSNSQSPYPEDYSNDQNRERSPSQ